jgi:FkbM family methyltransferase
MTTKGQAPLPLFRHLTVGESPQTPTAAAAPSSLAAATESMVIPHIIHFTVPKDVRPEQREAIERATALHPDWQVRVWRDPIDPDGFQLARYWPLVNSGAQLADLVRIEVVSRFGGIYLDADVLLLKRLDALADNCRFFVASENGLGATNAIFGAEAAHPALSEMIDELLKRPPDWSLPPSITTGPVLFGRMLKWRQDITLLPRESFYPYAYDERPKPPRPATYGVHTWCMSWTRPPSPLRHFERVALLWQWGRLARAVKRRASSWYRSNERALRLLSPRAPAYGAADTLVRQTVHGHYLLLDGRDLSVTPALATNGYYELSEELFVRRVLCGGDFFIDVGANMGVFAVLAAGLVGPFGRVFAYEPNPAVLELLAKSAVMNWVHDRMVLRPVAVGDAQGQSELDFTPYCLGGAAVRSAASDSTTFGRTATALPGSTSVTVDVVTLDSEFKYDIPIRMLKIDAEGFEAQVLAGARRLLANRCIEYLMLEAVAEISGRGWSALLDALEEVCRLGYQPFAVSTNGELVAVSLDAVARGWGMKTRNLVLRCVASGVVAQQPGGERQHPGAPAVASAGDRGMTA